MNSRACTHTERHDEHSTAQIQDEKKNSGLSSACLRRETPRKPACSYNTMRNDLSRLSLCTAPAPRSELAVTLLESDGRTRADWKNGICYSRPAATDRRPSFAWSKIKRHTTFRFDVNDRRLVRIIDRLNMHLKILAILNLETLQALHKNMAISIE